MMMKMTLRGWSYLAHAWRSVRSSSIGNNFVAIHAVETEGMIQVHKSLALILDTFVGHDDFEGGDTDKIRLVQTLWRLLKY